MVGFPKRVQRFASNDRKDSLLKSHRAKIWTEQSQIRVWEVSHNCLSFLPVSELACNRRDFALIYSMLYILGTSPSPHSFPIIPSIISPYSDYDSDSNSTKSKVALLQNENRATIAINCVIDITKPTIRSFLFHDKWNNRSTARRNCCLKLYWLYVWLVEGLNG